ncbi:MAG: choice-of-anchor D domain-containing protein, partial [Planctomycetota bacterium]
MSSIPRFAAHISSYSVCALMLAGAAVGGAGTSRVVPTVDFTTAAQSASESTATMTVTVQLSETAGVDVDVPFTVGGTAVDPDDYTITASPVTFTPGMTTIDITITLVGDALDEADETIVLTLGTPTNADLGTTTVHTATVQDDDPSPTVEFSVASQQVNEVDGSTLVIVQLSAASGLEVTVPFTVAGTATSPGDYTLSESSFVIPPGMTSDDVTLTIVDNLAHEGDETVELTLGAPTNAAPGGVTVHTVTIQDDDPQPTVEFTAAAQVMGEGDPPVTVTVQLSAASELDITVPFTVSGTATLLADYTLSGSPFFISAGAVSDSIQVIAVPDALNEPSETVRLDLDAPTNAGLGAGTSNTTTIVDDDPEPTVSFTILRQRVMEDAGVVPVQVELSAVSGGIVTVDFVASGTATDPNDYSLSPAAPGPLSIPAGALTRNIDVLVVDDLDASEGPESVILTIQSATGALVDPIMFRSAVMIEDNDSPTWNSNVRGLAVDVMEIPFDAGRVGESSDPVTVTVTNQQFVPITFNGIHSIGLHPADFDIDYPGSLPMALLPGQTTTFDVTFAPTEGGNRRARLVVQQSPHASPKTRIPVFGTAYGATGEEVRVNAFIDPYVDTESKVWLPDYGLTGTTATFSVVQPIANTVEDALYQRQRGGQSFSYAFDLPNGVYEVVLHFAETLNDANGARVFDVSIEGTVVLDEFDIRQTAGFLTAHQETLTVTLADGQLDIGFLSSSGEAVLAAMEIFSTPIVDADQTLLDFGTVGQGSFVDLDLVLTNTGLDTGTLESVSFISPPSGHVAGHDFSILIDGQVLYGDHATVTYPVFVPIAPEGGQVVFTVTFEPTEEEVNLLILRLEGDFGVIDVDLLGTGDHNLDWGFLHPVITVVPDLVVDYDGDMQERVQLFGSESHTHEPGVVLDPAAFEWSENSVIFATDPDTEKVFGLGDTVIELTIKDDDTPQGVATDGRTVSVYPPDAVPGILEYLYDSGGGDLITLMDNLPAQVDFIHRISILQALAENGFIRGTPFSGDVVVRWLAEFEVDQVADYDFQLTGGVDTRLFVDGIPVTGTLSALGVGTHTLDARYAVPMLGDLPLYFVASIDGLVDPGFGTDVTHDELGIVPVIHDMTPVGSELGGDVITIDGFGFYPYDLVTVHWGASIELTLTDFTTISSTRSEFLSPPFFGVSIIPVSVTTPAGSSNFVGFTYSPDIVPNTFVSAGSVPVVRATTGAWGPDGRFYVATLHGEIYAITYDDAYVGVSQVYDGIKNYTNDDILGIAFSPYDPPSPVKLYIAHGKHFAHQNGACVPPGEF